MKTTPTATETATSTMPTNPEYVEMLRAALAVAAPYIQEYMEHGEGQSLYGEDYAFGKRIWEVCK